MDTIVLSAIDGSEVQPFVFPAIKLGQTSKIKTSARSNVLLTTTHSVTSGLPDPGGFSATSLPSGHRQGNFY